MIVAIFVFSTVGLWGSQSTIVHDSLYAATALQNTAATAFTYQGQLSHSEELANDTFDFIFTLYNAENEGVKIAETDAQTATLQVENGAFTNLLDFGQQAFVNGPAWLEIQVRKTNVGAYAALSPRQFISAAPYATYANQTSWSGIRGLPIGFADGVDNDTIYTAGSGLLLQGGAFSVDTGVIQARVLNTCSEGQSIQSIAANGAVTCETDTIGLTNPVSFLNAEATNGVAISSETTNSNALVARNASDEYPAIFAENSKSSQSIVGRTNGEQASAIFARNLNTNATASIASPFGIYAHGNSNAGGIFSTSSDNDILAALTDINGELNIRFRVRSNGDVFADGTFTPNGADFAELLPGVGGTEPGDVLIIDPDGQLALSTTPNSSAIAGVYSTKPGILGGATGATGVFSSASEASNADNQQAHTQESQEPSADGQMASPKRSRLNEANIIAALNNALNTSDTAIASLYSNKIPLAVVGVVPTKAVNENGAIQPGDLLTSSSTPGHAMKALPVDVGGFEIYRTGTIIGKALEPLTEGTGVISVLLVLQ